MHALGSGGWAREREKERGQRGQNNEASWPRNKQRATIDESELQQQQRAWSTSKKGATRACPIRRFTRGPAPLFLTYTRAPSAHVRTLNRSRAQSGQRGFCEAWIPPRARAALPRIITRAEALSFRPAEANICSRYATTFVLLAMKDIPVN